MTRRLEPYADAPIDRRRPTFPPLVASLGCLVVLGCIVSPLSYARAAPPEDDTPPTSASTTLLDGREWLRLRSTLSSLSIQNVSRAVADGRARADQCRGRGESSLTCRCLSIRMEGLELRAGRWTLEASEQRARYLAISPVESPRTYYVGSWSSATEGSRLEDLAVAVERRALRIDRATLRKEAVELEGLRWLRARTPWTSPFRGCPRSADWSDWSGRVELRAASASFEGTSWSVRDLRSGGPVEVGLGDLEVDTPAPLGGLLPPRLQYTRGTFELQSSAIWGPAALGPIVTVAPGAWYGGGLQIASSGRRHADDPTRPSSPSLLEVQLHGSPERRGPDYEINGDVRRGSRYVHAAASLEEGSRPLFWELDRLRSPGVFRTWRTSLAGVSLSGPRHDLQLYARHRLPGQTSPAAFGETFSGGLRYGSDHRIATWLDASIGLEHASAIQPDGLDDHGTDLVGVLEARAGDAGAWFVEGALGARSGYAFALSQPSRSAGGGIRSRISGQIAAAARLGLGLEGRFDGIEHRLDPQIGVFREIAGVGGAGSFRRGGVGPPADRLPEWTAAVALLDQRWNVERVTLDMPIGIWHQSSGFDRWFDASPWGFGRLSLDADPLWIHGAVVHRAGDRESFFSGGSGLAWPHFRLGYRLGTLPGRVLGMAHLDETSAHVSRTMRRLQPIASTVAEPTPLHHSLRAEMQVDPMRTRLEWWSARDVGPGGGGVWVYRNFSALGWAVGLGMRADARPFRWGTFVGMSMPSTRF